MSNRFAIILAAGKGTRMRSKLYKVLHQVCGKPMIRHVIDEAEKADFAKIYVIVGHGANEVKAAVGNEAECLLQKEQLGTGHAVLQALDPLAERAGTTVVLCGDTPLITHQTIEKLIRIQEENQAAAAVLTAELEDPTGYGRVIRDSSGNVAKIVEHKDANPEEKRVKEINTGIYSFDNRKLFALLKQVTNNNAQGEYYLPDVIGLLVRNSEKVIAHATEQFEETVGVNDRIQLAVAENYMRIRINRAMMQDGVTLIDPDTTYLSAECKIGMDTVIYPGTVIAGKTRIGSGCTIGAYSQIRDCVIGDGAQIDQSVLENSTIGRNVQIGPFAHIRPLSKIHDQTKVGSFVDVKNTDIGERSGPSM
ncbi:bifunctional UDP-N-acetylglucosamine diphosphorylase/glucosamine-1-phosphate N-acetyltransferase GlmU [Sporolactobacillus shoreicorticis]|uniref:Bifunctional UDP-N-acetylglucosamine diphosphorylase/glucosamine-1-phosphate N-acetyltransferase GlmU n=1 Tax=Sporolactobacillus shoreicorticis TaxID=1923877 RepID=A0ABW5S945_9BACL|nr:bifunctional UDP-N-acetylglucosamine diphosphorylase/glucosamine-1-phosphate N-acetyltransferase GlmU [Sporolactobacillus shoreicorticis]MCO7127728.1 bifunctional UDP-N-acetylglucosamine diphosphorylase/glucosamine-1-phosphate N-acetyltransferase GlmU [Sporolactobacillus shoreicorticis]